MSKSKFYYLLIVTLAITALILFGLSYDNKMSDYLNIAYYAIPGFSVLSIVVYYLTEYLERTKQDGLLFSIVIVNMMIKMFIVVIVISLYYSIAKPKDGIFVVPFIIVYVTFTIFETYFMSEQARIKRRR